MKLSEVIISEGLGDWASKAAYLSGMSGENGSGKELVIRDNFIEKFSQQYKLAKQARASAGAAFNPVQFVSNYASKNQWNVDPTELSQAVTPIANDPTKLAQYVYSIAMDQSGSVQSGIGANTKQKKALASAAASTLTPTAKQVVGMINKMRGEQNYDDLEYVAKSAMRALYKQNPQAYNDLYKEIMAGDTKKQVASAAGSNAFGQMATGLGAKPNTMANAPVSQRNFEPNPNIVRGTNESKRK